INTMVMAGLIIALGSVVDDAIIDIENIVRRLRENRRQASPRSTASVVFLASLEIRRPILFATLIIVLAVTPVFFMGGLSGAFFTPLAVAYLLAMLASMIVALTVTPALALILLGEKGLTERESPIVPWLQARYTRLLTPILRAPRSMFAATIVTALIGAGIWPILGQSLLPEFQERDFLMHWVTPPGTSRQEMYRITVQSSKELRAIPGVRNFGAHIGRAVGGDEPYGINFTENWISVDPKVDLATTRKKVEEVVAGYPGLYRDVLTYLRERIKEVLTGSGESIVVRIYGPDLAVLRAKALEVKTALTGIDGLIDLHEEYQNLIPQVQVRVNIAKARSVGLKPGDIRRQAAAVMAGIEVTDIHREGKVYDVFVWTAPDMRHSLTQFKNMLIDTPAGDYVRLQDLAEIAIKPTPNIIKRENVSRRMDVNANVHGRDLGSIVRDVDARLKTISLPLGYHVEQLGEYAERKAATNALSLATIAAVIGIFFLLQMSFGSWRLATLAFMLLPAALVGGVIAAYIGGGVISLGSLVGFLTVLGIAARNGILLIDHCQHLEHVEGVGFGPELVLRGARERLAPILMTSITTALAIAPLVVYGNLPGHEIEHPMAVVILGGLATSTLLNLFVIPALYLRYGHGTEPSSGLSSGLSSAPA
ncbi:MAG: efflux RND transporter permease subunit, partial [Pseudomonas sp.]|uniref:efflux RND transporter permease subunit n=1 Tax=Pseudomonas sp. TaxID=306 RepID=UPI003C74C846